MRSITRIPLLLATACVLAPLTSQAAWVTLGDATGWNEDVIYGNGEPGPAGAITSSIDSGPGQTGGASWIQQGVDVFNPDHGLNTGGTTLSATGSGASFFVQSATSDNALMLAPGSTGSLTLASPTSFTSLALYGSSGNGEINGTLTVHYADLTSQTFALGAVAKDWFFVDENIAQAVGGREYDNGFVEDDGDNPRVYEQLYTLNSTSAVVSLEINNINRVEDGDGGYLALLAVSGNTVPEPSAALLTAGLGLLGLVRRRRA